MRDLIHRERPSVPDIRWGEVLIVPAATLLMAIGLFLFHPFAGLAGLVVSAFLGVHSYLREKEAATRTLQAIESLDTRFDEVTKNAVFGMPFPMAVLSGSSHFLWYNATFKKLFAIEGSMLGKPAASLAPALDHGEIDSQIKEPVRLVVGDRVFEFYHNVTEAKNGETLILLYGVDNTEDEEVRALYKAEQAVVAVLFFDNYDEVRSATNEEDRPLLFAQVDRAIADFASNYDASLVKYESDRYFLVFKAEALERLREDRFPILDSLREISAGAAVRPTASIGIGILAESPQELFRYARQALDIALSRGGNQVVIKNEDDVEYFGGKTQATQRYTKVKARVTSNTLRGFVSEATNVLIMGHQNPDMDSLGSCLGMLRFVEALGGQGKIVLDTVPAAIENLYERVLRELPDANDKIVFAPQARRDLKKGTLIVVLDNHRHDAVAAPALLDEGNRIIIIDHHRRGAGYIENAEVSYIEPYASSTSEMVTELISYQDEDISLPKIVSEGLLAGITVDTKNFFYQTGTRTFEAAAYLKRKGADSVMIKELFKDNVDLVRYRSEILAGAEVLDQGIMIGRFPHDIDGSTLIASQAADDLLGIRDVEASFVLTLSKGRVHISARSLGEVSVQLIMEKMGGGGHLTAAATQLDTTLGEAEKKLKEAIMEYIKEDQDESHTS